MTIIEAITVVSPTRLYTMTIMCPICHNPLAIAREGVTVCDVCKNSFIVKPATSPQNFAPSEVK